MHTNSIKYLELNIKWRQKYTFITPVLLRVETIFGEKRVVRCCLVPHGGRQLFL